MGIVVGKEFIEGLEEEEESFGAAVEGGSEGT